MKRYIFTPKPDLTTLELAEIFTVTIVALIEGITGKPQTGSDTLELEEHLYKAIPDDSKKHFTKTE